MKPTILLITGAMVMVIFIAGIVFAGGMGGGGMGGGGNGMMCGGHMRGSGQGYALPFQDLYNRYMRSDQPNSYGPKETERLRQEIREKRKELKELYSSGKPDNDLIDKRIDELSKLEAKLGYRLSKTEYQRR